MRLPTVGEPFDESLLLREHSSREQRVFPEWITHDIPLTTTGALAPEPSVNKKLVQSAQA